MSRSRLIPFLIILLVTIVGGVRSSMSRHVAGDFLRYHRAGRLIATGHADQLYDVEYRRGAHVYAEERAEELARRGDKADEFKELEYKYMPATAVLLAPLGALHPRTANTLWGAWNGFLIGLLFVSAWSMCTAVSGGKLSGGTLSGHWMWLPVIALGHAANDNHNLGQLNPSAIAPATVAVVLLARRRDVAAGLIAAFGTVVKFMPGALAIWFLWKRRWKAFGALLLGVALIGWALPAIALGPARSHRLFGEWVEARSHHYTSAKSSDLPGHSIKSFTYRVLGDTPYVTGGRRKRRSLDVSLVVLPPGALYWLVMALNIAVLGAVMWWTRGPLRNWHDARGPPEAALFIALLLLISPEARGPHFLYLALPMTAAVYALIAWGRRERAAGGVSVGWRVAVGAAVLAAILLYTNSKSLFGRDLAMRFVAYCTLGWSTALIMGVLAAALRRLPDAAVAAAPGATDPESPPAAE